MCSICLKRLPAKARQEIRKPLDVSVENHHSMQPKHHDTDRRIGGRTGSWPVTNVAVFQSHHKHPRNTHTHTHKFSRFVRQKLVCGATMANLDVYKQHILALTQSDEHDGGSEKFPADDRSKSGTGTHATINSLDEANRKERWDEKQKTNNKGRVGLDVADSELVVAQPIINTSETVVYASIWRNDESRQGCEDWQNEETPLMYRDSRNDGDDKENENECSVWGCVGDIALVVVVASIVAFVVIWLSGRRVWASHNA